MTVEIPFDVHRVRSDFPLLARNVANRPIVYFDNAATALKPRQVVAALRRHYEHSTSNIHRGRHLLSQEASNDFEAARERVARAIGASASEVVFVRGATEGVNLVADGMRLDPADNVVGTELEHHSNILPWRSRCEYKLSTLLPSGLPDVDSAARLIDDRTRALVVSHCSNVTGAYVPLEPWVALARAKRVPILVDAAQSAAHRALDVVAMDCDFMVLSGHKMCGPVGAGVLYGKSDRLEMLEPRMLGGGTVSIVRADGSYVLRELPWRLEAGTPDIAAVIALGAAFDYLSTVGRDAIERHLVELRRALERHVVSLPGFKFLAPWSDVAAPIVSLVEESGTFPPDYLSRMLSDTYGIMTRSGHHCAHPLHERLGFNGSLRVSLQMYNTEEEVLYLRDALIRLQRMTGH
jgi:cysteine desulfurase/selenocysteine lyase